MMVTVSAVSGALAVKRTSSSSNHGLFVDGSPLKVAGPPAVDATVTVSGSTTDLLSDPLVPVTVMLPVPTAALLAAVSDSVLELVVEAGLKAAVTPLGTPLATSDTLPVNPPDGAMLITGLMAPPCAMDSMLGFADSVKLGCIAAALTVSSSVAVAVNPPLIPVIVRVLVPLLAVMPALNVSVLDDVVVAGLKLAVTPFGRPLTLSATVPVNPPEGLTDTVALPAEPAVSASDPEPSAKVNDAGAVVEVGLKMTVVSE